MTALALAQALPSVQVLALAKVDLLACLQIDRLCQLCPSDPDPLALSLVQSLLLD
jgi:hypothetical protein